MNPHLPIKDRIRGLIAGILAPMSFGFMPLFTMPLIRAGMGTSLILTYRFAIAAAILLFILLLRKKSLRLSRKNLLLVIILGLIYVWSAAGVQIGYRFMPTGISTVIHFTYPIWVIVIMLFFYKQRPAPITLVAIILAILGVAFLVGVFGSSQKIPAEGFYIVASTGLAYAIYLVIMSKNEINREDPVKVSFYVMTIAAIGFMLISLSIGGIDPVPGRYEAICMLLLCLVSTVIANILLVIAVKNAGATTNSVLGALEPLTAVILGIMLLGEKLTTESIVGIGFIILSILIISLSGRIAYILKVRRLQHRHKN